MTCGGMDVACIPRTLTAAIPFRRRSIFVALAIGATNGAPSRPLDKGLIAAVFGLLAKVTSEIKASDTFVSVQNPTTHIAKRSQMSYVRGEGISQIAPFIDNAPPVGDLPARELKVALRMKLVITVGELVTHANQHLSDVLTTFDANERQTSNASNMIRITHGSEPILRELARLEKRL